MFFFLLRESERERVKKWIKIIKKEYLNKMVKKIEVSILGVLQSDVLNAIKLGF